MNIKMLCMGAMALSMMTGAALAAGTTGTSALDDPQKMTPFFTDAGMKTMKSEAEIKAAWMAMSTSDRAMMLKECSDAGIAKMHADFCKMANQLGGANK
ncbi:hypothetical protein [Mesorhizobium sp. M1163]|uniref:hypothetical protein n=1 Tax=Mesorhizobium sp. M1163 TaxID=2957065 RepID=UPI003338B5F0